MDYHDMTMHPNKGQWCVLYHCLSDFLLDHNILFHKYVTLHLFWNPALGMSDIT